MGNVKKYYPFRYNIYTFSMAKLLAHGSRAGNTLTIQDRDVVFCFQDVEEQYETKQDCILFYQTRLVLKPNVKGVDNIYSSSRVESNEFKELFITINFDGVLFNFEKVMGIKYIEIRVPGASCKFKYELFMKSNSMSKNCKVLYINSDKVCPNGKLADLLNERLNFNMMKETISEFVLSKWFAYSGLSLSDGILLDDLLVTEENSLVVPDFERVMYTSCVTAVSLRSINAAVLDYFKENKPVYKDNAFKKLKSIVNSKDWQGLINAESKRHGAKLVYDAISYVKGMVEKVDETTNLLPTEDKDKWEAYYKGLLEKDENKQGVSWFEIQCDNYPYKFNAFDGEGLISYEMADLINQKLKQYGLKDEDHYSFQIRLPFVKGVLHACDMHSFFTDNNVKSIKAIKIIDGNDNQKGLNEEEYIDLSKIHFIFTKSQIKFAKLAKEFGTENQWKGYVRRLVQYNHKFVITKTEPDQNECGRLNLQFFSTLPLTTKEYDHILDDAKMELNHSLSTEEMLKNLNEIDSRIRDANKDFYVSSESYRDFHTKRYSTFIKDSLQLKLPVAKSRRLFLSSDLIMLLNIVCDIKDPNGYLKSDGQLHRSKKGELEKYQCYIPNGSTESGVFEENDHAVILRNPHYSRNEISILRCAKETSLRKKYFGKLKGVIWMDPYSLTAERLGGADYDGDEVLVITDQMLRHRLYGSLIRDNKLKYPLSIIPSLNDDSTNRYTLENVLNCFKKTFSNEVGHISNEALRVTEYAYHQHSPILPEQSWGQYANLIKQEGVTRANFVAFYTILGGLSIDAAKKGYKPVFVPAKLFTNTDTATLREQYTTSRFIDFKDAVKGMKYFDSQAIRFTSSIAKAKEGPLGKKYDQLCSSQAEESFWAKYLINAVQGWKYNPPEQKEFTIEEDGSSTRNVIAFLKAVAIRDIVFSYVSTLRDRREELLLKQQVIKATIRGSSLITKNNEDEKMMWTMINSLSETLSDGRTWTDVLHDYCTAKRPFHYLETENEKDSFIRDHLHLSRDDITADGRALFKDFRNGGFKNLYLAILYKSLEETVRPIKKQFPSSIDDLKKVDWKWINKDNIKNNKSIVNSFDVISESINAGADKLIGMLETSRFKSAPIREYKRYVIDELVKEYINICKGDRNFKSITIPNAQYITDVQDSKAVMDLLPDELVEYLKKA